MTHRLGVDIGGTFTDFALVDDKSGRLNVFKQLTTPTDPSEAVLKGLALLLERTGVDISELSSIAHGTTLVTNAVIERKGATTGILVTEGFSDVFDIALERRYDLFDLRLRFAAPVVPKKQRLEIKERIKFDGKVEQALDEQGVKEAISFLVERLAIKSLAICFLHSYVNSYHEKRVAEIARDLYPELHVTSSSDVLPFMREYERWTTTAVNAYVQPLTDNYLYRVESGLSQMGFKGRFLVMTSSGGMATTNLARRFPVRLIESGPAAGALMAAFLGSQINEPNLLSFDMGGTTAKGALIKNSKTLRRYELEVAREYQFKQGSGLPLQIPVVDMIEIGAGGGSIAAVNDGNLFSVGPLSAGADPGPACYGRGGELPTLTDANVRLGYLEPDKFLGGDMQLDARAATNAIEKHLANTLKITVERAAWGVHEGINEEVVRAFRVHASEIGFDYRNCAMVAFGGSAPAHAMRVARKLRIPKVIFPVGAGVMSAIGLLTVPISFATLQSQRMLLQDLDLKGIEDGFTSVEIQARTLLEESGLRSDEISIERRLDMRFQGQGYEVEVILPSEFAVAEIKEIFLSVYAETFAAMPLESPIEIVNWKIEATGPTPDLVNHYNPIFEGGGDQNQGQYVVCFDANTDSFIEFSVYKRHSLSLGTIVEGPALIQENEATTVLHSGESIEVDEMGNLIAILAGSRD